jgi:5-methylcytosine-specific restriction endonuclease McrA
MGPPESSRECSTQANACEDVVLNPRTTLMVAPFLTTPARAPGHDQTVLLPSRPMDGVVLVLNQNYEPLNVCNLPRAFRLVFGEKAEVIEYDHQVIRTPRTSFRAPSVIRLQYQIRRPRPRVKLSRREIFARDRHTCQYCGRQTHDLTLDHIVPRHRGGGHTWENLVTACKACNHRKGGKTIDEIRFRLHRPPFEPRSDVYSLFTPYLADDRNEAWRTYLFLGRN